MKALHPRVVKNLLGQLPADAAITGYDSVSHPGETTLTVETKGGIHRLGLPKVVLSDHLNATEVTLLVDEGQTATSVIELFSKKYNLFWVAESDFTPSDKVVVFDDKGEALFDIKVLDDSPFWMGQVTLKLLNKADHTRPTDPAEVPLDNMRINLALTSKIFQGDGKVFNKDKTKITPAFARKVYAHLKGLGFTTLGPDDIGNSELIDVVTDGFSGMVVCKPKKGPHLFIRFRSKGEDLVPASPGDLDPV